ncbi:MULTISPECIES: hypothetical protein [unclassified Variovorax]|uniref:hypothetical protein n=1 Tax=unclassified Variovorax TaxID=663243 RepID=UPI002576D4F5|nr:MULTISPECIES: hypothetical protein [unclassified Variovorax]MDM0085936.1 hypothetical protein [Variovorax sp. J22G40]MDM0145807.1 hypothetical protein [Variovorax sp. J2P1-31]
MKSPESWLKFEPRVVLTRNGSLNANSMPILLAAGGEEIRSVFTASNILESAAFVTSM